MTFLSIFRLLLAYFAVVSCKCKAHQGPQYYPGVQPPRGQQLPPRPPYQMAPQSPYQPLRAPPYQMHQAHQIPPKSPAFPPPRGGPYPGGMDAPGKSPSDMTLDEILQNPRAQQVIMDESHSQIVERMGEVVEQVGEEIIEAIENDAQAAMIAEKEETDLALTSHPSYLLTTSCVVLLFLTMQV